jgi:uncharacterized DUF497 family protein
VAFQWDPKKARSNLAKHGVSFAHSVGAFEDPRAITVDDPHPREERYVTIGLDLMARLVVVSWTPRGNDIRLISARRVTKPERTDYEGND